ncbi:response regulator [Desulfovibrio sp. 86]|uniref:histidine kinase n=1 Tax=uncultured Desulfovibrio sp. TaxID=167968 RepID=A0A212L3Z5_9BACT|nr:response regulator [Desulfovibrio sp. 86]SCM72271.1 Hpt sensor hybrid histidine kinase [uncultured Desulfovibrio sp.]VZH33403.1 Histidine kinase [Desulfovibrio sp. 86]
MSIRTLIKTSNMAQLVVVLMLGLCIIWLGRSLSEVNGLLHNYYRVASLLVEIGNTPRESYHAALDYLSTGDDAHLERWRRLLREARGEAPRPDTASAAPGECVALAALVDHLEADASTRAQMHALLAQVDTFNIMTEDVVNLALGQKPDSNATADAAWSARPGPQAALRMMRDCNLARLPDAIAADASKLGSTQYADLFVRLDTREALLRWAMLAAMGGLILLGASALGNACIFITRVANPLDRVIGYAESVAAGLDPAPLQLRHRDELAGMFASLQRMKDTLFSRISELKEVEMWARKSRQQAIQARSQALTSLELAQRASHVQDDFLRRISHEIRTPLNAIIGMSYLSLQTDLSGVQRDYLAHINKSGSVLLDMVNRILDFSSASEGSMRMERRVFDLPGFLELLRQSVAGTALEKRLLLSVVRDTSIPATVAGDERHLEEVLRILLDNAVKYTVRGSVALRVQRADEPAATEGALRLTFVVEDSGPGLREEDWKKLFEPFALGDESMTRSRSGLGLGLALARQLVSLMGGELEVFSVPGEGSRFFFSVDVDTVDTFSLSAGSAEKMPLARPVRPAGGSSGIFFTGAQSPAGEPGGRMRAMSEIGVLPEADATPETGVGPEAAAVRPAVAAEGVKAPDQAEFPPRTVLVVEDNDINAQIARELLQQAGLNVVLAANGQEALDRLKAPAHTDIALVLMDVQMPVMDGLEATRRIRREGFAPVDLPVIAMTAHADMSSRMDGKDVGMNAYLTKPVNPETLYTCLEKWLPGGLRRNPFRKARAGDARPPDPQAGSFLSNSGEEDSHARCLQAIKARMKGQHNPVINIEAGLATVGNDRKLYLELLFRFVEHYGDSAVRLRDMLRDGDLDAASRLAHTVKGVAANLGVERILRLTRMMENALPDTPLDPGLLNAFEAEMARVLESVQGVKGLDRETRSGNLQLAEEHRTALLALLGELPQRAERDWGGVENALETLIPLMEGTPHAEEVAAILVAVKDFDMDGMTDKACRLRKKLLRGQA